MNINRWRLQLGGVHEQAVYTCFAIAIIYSFFLWTLLNSILCIMFVAYWLIVSKKYFDLKTRETKLMLVFIFLYLVSLAGMLYTDNLSEGWTNIQRKAPILVFPLIFGTTRLFSIEHINKIIRHFAIGMAGVAIISLLYALFNLLQPGNKVTQPGEMIFILPGFYRYLLGLCGILSIIILINGPGNKKSFTGWLHVVIGIIITVYVLMLNTRLITFLLAATILYYAYVSITYTPYRLLVSFLLVFSLVLSVIFVPVIANRWKELGDFSSDNTIQLDKELSLGRGWGGKAVRVAIWKCSFDIISRHWVAGVGTGDVQDSLQAAYEQRKFYFASRFNQFNAHNQYIQNMIGNGLPGLLSLLAVIIVPFFLVRRDNLRNGYIPFLLLFAAICYSEVILNTNKGIIWYAFFNSLLAFPVNKSN